MKFIGLHPSDKPDKKYYALFQTDSGREKKVYFGAAGMKDFTRYPAAVRQIHKEAYLARHKVTEDWNQPDTPGSLARWILWNKTTVRASLADYKRRFGFN